MFPSMFYANQKAIESIIKHHLANRWKLTIRVGPFLLFVEKPEGHYGKNYIESKALNVSFHLALKIWKSVKWLWPKRPICHTHKKQFAWFFRKE